MTRRALQGGPMLLVMCDGNRILCEALATALEARGHKVPAVATTAGDCIEAVASYQPDVCVLDLYLPGPEDGLQAIRQIRCRCPDTAVLVVSELSDPDIWTRAKQLGVAGLVGKDRSVSQITEALNMIVNGEPVFDPVPPQGVPRPAAPFMLTPREAEVLRRIVAGQDTQQMAGEMNIAVSTLRSYVKNVLAKLGAHSRLEAAAVASQESLPAEPSVLPAVAVR
jgi:two-component system, NarL family, nitrate/nitrite response regulator NarL